jgi:hypothetical protein
VVITQDIVNPIAIASEDDTLTCIITDITLNGLASTPQDILDFMWTAEDGGNILSGEETAMPVVNAAGRYILLVTNTDNGCTDRDTVLIAIDTLKPTASAGDDVTIDCDFLSTTLDASSSQGQDQLSYAWTTIGGNILNGAGTATPEVDTAGLYIVTVTDSDNGCVAMDTVEVFMEECLPGIDIQKTVYAGHDDGDSCP